MLQEFMSARRRAVSPLFAHALALVALAAGFVAAVPAAAATQAAAIGVYRPSVTKFILDGNFDLAPDLKVVFGAPGDVGLMGDLAGAGTRSPVLYRNGQWLVDSNKDGTIDQTINFGGAPNDIPLIADMNGDGREDLVLYRDGTWFVRDTVDGALTATYNFGGVPGDVPLLGDVNGTGVKGLFIYRNGYWYGSTTRATVGGQDLRLRRRPGRHSDDVRLRRRRQGRSRHLPQRHLVHFDRRRRPLSLRSSATVSPATRRSTPAPARSARTYLDATRFLSHASFGPIGAENTAAAGNCVTPNMAPCFSAYIDAQFAKPATILPPMAFQPQNQPGNCTEPADGGRARRRDQLRHQLSARSLHAVRFAALLLQERAHRARPASPARCLGAVPDRRGFGGERSDRVREPQLSTDAAGPRVRQLLQRPVPHQRRPADGQLPRHGQQREGGPGQGHESERELRARDHAALLDRALGIEHRRHAVARREQQPDPDVLADRHHRNGEGHDGVDVLAAGGRIQVERTGQLCRQHDAVRGQSADRGRRPVWSGRHPELARHHAEEPGVHSAARDPGRPDREQRSPGRGERALDALQHGRRSSASS